MTKICLKFMCKQILIDKFYCYSQEKPAILDVILCQNLTGNNLPTLSSDGSIFACGFKAWTPKTVLQY